MSSDRSSETLKGPPIDITTISDSDDDIGVDLTGVIIEVLVGLKRKHYSIHENRLRRCCRFFDQKINNADTAMSKKTICLEEDDPEAFELFATWLYKGKIKPINSTMKYREGPHGFVKDHVATVDPYFELYFKSQERGLVALKNHTLDVIRGYAAEERFVWSPVRADQVYTRTQPGSTLRRYVVENYLHHYLSKKLDEDIARNATSRRLRMGTGLAFALDMFESIREHTGKWRDPDKYIGCDFHDHEDGSECVH